jgi:hypothetical protein
MHWYDSAEAEQIIRETDFLTSAVPSKAELSQVAAYFQQLIEEHGDQLRHRFSARLAVEQQKTYESWPAFSNAPVPPGPYLSYIYSGPDNHWRPSDDPSGKIDPSLWEALYENGLAIGSGDGRNRYLAMHPRLAWVYMSALAELMANNRGYSPVTDVEVVYRAMGLQNISAIAKLCLEDNHMDSGNAVADLRQTYVHIALSDVVPVDLADVSMTKLIKFRQHRQDELTAFHEHIEVLGSRLQTLTNVPDAQAVREHLQLIYERETLPLLSDLRRALNSNGMDTAGSTLVLKFDGTSVAGSALGTAALATGAGPIVAATGFAVAVVSTLVPRLRQRRELQRKSPVAYLLSIKKELRSPNLLRRILQL